jgi:hypothetical protein
MKLKVLFFEMSSINGNLNSFSKMLHQSLTSQISLKAPKSPKAKPNKNEKGEAFRLPPFIVILMRITNYAP